MDNKIYKFTINDANRIYYSNGWGIYNCLVLEDIPHKRYGYITLIGNMQDLNNELSYEVEAKIVENKQYGMQYEVSGGIKAKKPTTIDAQKNFLKSIISEDKAMDLLKKYPNIVEKVIDNNFDISYDLIPGIREKTWKKIKEKIKDNFSISDLLSMLIPLGITYGQVQRMLNQSINAEYLKQEISNNPYFLISFHGFGFKTVDKIALKIKPELEVSRERVEAFITHILKEEGMSNGHTWIKLEDLIKQVNIMMPKCMNIFIEFIKQEKIDENILHIRDNMVGLRRYWMKEMACIDMILEIQKSKLPYKYDKDKIALAIKEANERQGFDFTKEQTDAIYKILHNNFSVLTAKAGVGKTVTSRGVLNALKNFGMSIASCAFTAKASKRVTEATGFKATTIHRLLESNGKDKFRYNIDNKLPYNVIFLDEAGMVSVDILYNLLVAIDHNKTILIMVGDDQQLKPIGYGDIFSDIIENDNVFNVVKMFNVMRQAEDSGILMDANKIREGINPIADIQPMVINGRNKDNIYIFRDDKNDLNQIAISLYMKFIRDGNSIEDIVIMTPTRQNGINASNNINIQIQDILLPTEKRHINVFGVKYKLGAKVMHTVNNKELDIYNGDTGYIVDIVKKADEHYCIVDYGSDIGKRRYDKIIFDQLSLAYALTVHKLQGSGIQNTIAIYDTSHRIMLNNTLSYTAMTRSEKRNITLLMRQTLPWILSKKDSYRQTWAKIETLEHHKIINKE